MRPITREHFLWAIVILAVVVTRAAAPDFPLGEAEAQGALAALQAARGAPATLLVPLFGMLQSAALALFGDSNAAARSVALAGGIALCLWPLSLRDVIGRGRALMLALLLCVSPTVMFVGREVLGSALAWTVAAFVVGSRTMRPPVRAALLGLLPAFGIDGAAPLIVVLLIFAMSGRLRELRVLANGRAGVAFAIAFVLGATGMLWRPSGVADAFEGWAAWVRGGREIGRMVLGVATGEGLTILFAGIAAVRALVKRVSEKHAPIVDGDALRFGAAWLSAGLVALLLLPARGASTATAAAIGAAVLASVPLTLLVERLRTHSAWVTWATFALAFVMLQFVGVGLRNYIMQDQAAYLLPVAIALVMTVGVLASAALNEQAEAAVLGLGAASAATLLLFGAATGLRATQRGWDQPTEPYVSRAPQPGLAALVDLVRQASVRATGEPTGVTLFVDDSAPAVLRWALRAQTKLRYGASIGTQDMALLPAAKKPAESRAFVGSRFRIERSAGLEPMNSGGTALLRWLLYRQGGTTGSNDAYWTLWVSDSLAADMSGRK